MADGGTLAEFRSIACLTQGDIATRMGISVQAVSQIERRDYVRPDTAKRFQKAVVTAIREEAVGGLIGDAMKGMVSLWSERAPDTFIRQIA